MARVGDEGIDLYWTKSLPQVPSCAVTASCEVGGPSNTLCPPQLVHQEGLANVSSWKEPILASLLLLWVYRQPFQSTTAPCALLSLHILMQGAWTLQHLITSFECASRKGFNCGIHGLAHPGMVATIKGFLPTHLALLVTSNLTTTL